LTEEGRLDLTVEALVLKPEYAALFTDVERSIAARRLSVGALVSRDQRKPTDSGRQA
jgi:hypothetical protein